MALAAGSPVAVTSGDTVSNPRICKVDTDVAVVTYADLTNSDVSGKVLNVSGGSIDVGARQQLYNGSLTSGSNASAQAGTGKLAIAYAKSASAGSEAVIVTRSGETLSEGTPAEFLGTTPSLSMSLAVNGAAAIAGIFAESNTTPILANMAISGDITLDDSANHGGSSGETLGIVSMDSDEYMLMYEDGSNNLYFQMIDLGSSTISEGTEDDSAINLVAGYVQLVQVSMAQLSANKAIACVPRDLATDALSLFTINRSVQAITSYGSPTDVYTGATIYYGAIAVIDSTNILLFYRDGSGNESVQSFSISGDTVTAGGDTDTITTDWTGMGGAVVVSGNRAIVCWEDASGDIQASLVTGFGSLSYGFQHSADGVPGGII